MICGLDEAGRGPCFGPLVVAGVTFQTDEKLIEYNIRDSKKITPQRRSFLADKIRDLAEEYRYIIIHAEDIDDMRRVMTLNEIEVNAFSKIVEKLHVETCYVDAADVNETRFGHDIMLKLSYTPKIISKHKADEIYPIVGAASILAKTIRDQEVEKIAKKLREELDMDLGSGYPADPITKNFLTAYIQKYGTLPPHVRKSWKTCEKLIQQFKTRTLDDF
jgi:ribonuclease HII